MWRATVNILCIEMRPLLRSSLRFVQVCLQLCIERFVVARVAFFYSMGGLYETRKTGSDPQQRRGNVNRRMCRLAFLLVPQQPPRSPRFARLARRPALDPQEDNHIGVHHKQRKRYLQYGQAAICNMTVAKLEEWARMRDGGKGGGQLSIGKMKADQWPSQWDLGTLNALNALFSVPKSH